MKAADLQLAMGLTVDLQKLANLYAGSAVLAIDGQEPVNLDSGELADFLDWRRQRICRRLRALGVDPGGEDAPDEPAPVPAAVSQPRQPDRAAAGAAAPSPATPARPRRRAAGPTAKPPAKQMSLAQATTEARRRILGPIEAELRRNGGYLDDPATIANDLAAMAEKRAGDIAQLAQELMRGPPPLKSCCRCDRPANTIIDGRDYCATHAKTAARPGMPELAA